MNMVIIILCGIVSYYSIVNIFKQKKHFYLYVIFYLILLFLILFNRSKKEEFGYSNGSYIFKWMEFLFTNKIIFINVIGNIFLFVPMGIIIKIMKLKFFDFLLLVIFIIILIETIQYISKRGVFDISDIVLNLIGSILGYILIRKRGEKYE